MLTQAPLGSAGGYSPMTRDVYHKIVINAHFFRPVVRIAVIELAALGAKAPLSHEHQ